jgi:hypothetical protein
MARTVARDNAHDDGVEQRVVGDEHCHVADGVAVQEEAETAIGAQLWRGRERELVLDVLELDRDLVLRLPAPKNAKKGCEAPSAPIQNRFTVGKNAKGENHRCRRPRTMLWCMLARFAAPSSPTPSTSTPEIASVALCWIALSWATSTHRLWFTKKAALRTHVLLRHREARLSCIRRGHASLLPECWRLPRQGIGRHKAFTMLMVSTASFRSSTYARIFTCDG